MKWPHTISLLGFFALVGAMVLLSAREDNPQLYLGLVGLLVIIGLIALLAILARGADAETQKLYLGVITGLVGLIGGLVGGLGSGTVAGKQAAEDVQADQEADTPPGK